MDILSLPTSEQVIIMFSVAGMLLTQFHSILPV